MASEPSGVESSEFGNLVKLGSQLGAENITKLANILKVPAGMYENVTQGGEFLYILRNWDGHNRFLFYKGLQDIGRTDLAKLSTSIPWLAVEPQENKALIELGNELKPNDIKKLAKVLNVPFTIEEITDGKIFLQALKDLKNYDRNLLYQILIGIRPDLFEEAVNFTSETGMHPADKEKSIKTLVRALNSNLGVKDWIAISLIVPVIKIEMPFESKVKMLNREGYISRDLTRLSQLMSDINRKDIRSTLQQHESVLYGIPESLFILRFEREAISIGRDIAKWEGSLRRHLEIVNLEVIQLLDDEVSVNIESVYVPLTIIKEEPRLVNLDDETTYNEIALLRKIWSKEIDITPVDFTEELKSYDSSEPEIWCLIGNPGSGKSFICQKTALQFGRGELPQFSFTISIPCRNPDWHKMEYDQHSANFPIVGEFIEKWLQLSMPVGPNWATDLSKHLVKSDGKGLFLIIDSLDEYTKEVPFSKTFLFLLLTRRALTQSSILLTSRPGAYTNFSSSHTLHIDQFFHVLGFSPDNRDLYFSKQLSREEYKLEALQSLLELHEEMQQLSLIPVNASLFAALIRGSDKVSVYTLTHLYTELITYLIRRQLSRMGLKRMAKKQQSQSLLLQLHPYVLECLYRIGEVAYMGVSCRELISSQDVLLKVDTNVEKACQCLGLAEEHTKRDDMGQLTRVWSFSHLTIQEWLGAYWLSVSSSGDQCLSTRYIVNTDEHFSIFKMVLRFLCGLLFYRSRHVLYLLFKHLPTSPMPMLNMPMHHQLYYDDVNKPLPKYMGWSELTEKFVAMSEMLFESDSDAISEYFPYFRTFLPQSLYFYFHSSTSPNEWKCFVSSLPLLHSIHLISLDTRYVTLSQFKSLVTLLTSCSLTYLSIKLYDLNYSTLSAYFDVIQHSQLTYETKMSLELYWCNLTDTEPTDHELTSINHVFTNLSLICTNFPRQFLQQIGDQLIHTNTLLFQPSSIDYYDTLFPHLTTALQLTALHLYSIPTEYEQQLQTILSKLTNLQEITLNGKNPYSLLPHISRLSSLKYLHLSSYRQSTYTSHKDYLLQLLNTNSHSLRGLELSHLQSIGMDSWDELLISLQSCTNLVVIQLQNTALQHDDITLWCTVVSRIRSLLWLNLSTVPLSDAVLTSLCRGLLHHPTMRCIELRYCELSSYSCIPLRHLLPTLPQLDTLLLVGNSVSKPDPDPVYLLLESADRYFVSLEL